MSRRSVSTSFSRASARISAQAARTAGVARRASKSARLAPWRAATSTGKSVGAAPALAGKFEQHTRQRERRSGGKVGAGFVVLAPACGYARGEAQAGALALIGEILEGMEGEIVLRLKLLQPGVEHGFEIAQRQRVSLYGGGERKHHRIARPFLTPVAQQDFAPPREAHRHEVRVASAKAGLPDFIVEGGERDQRIAPFGRRIKGAEPFVAGVFADERRAIGVGLRERVEAAHGAAISAAATRRPSSCMML